MQANWKIRDLIDLEYFLAEKKEDSPNAAPVTPDLDRKIYLEYPSSEPAPASRRQLIRFWLDRRRQHEQKIQGNETLLPGTAYVETIAITRILSAFLGALIGAALVWGLFSYQGRQPINVFTCLWVLVVPQVLLILLLLLSGLLRRLGLIASFRRLSVILAALSRLMILRISRMFRTRLTTGTRDRIRSAIGFLGQARTVYGSVFYWPFFLTAQLFGIFFNVGILAAMLIRVSITDLAFGWQSTLQLSTETVYAIVRAISTPWAWLVSPPVSHPTMDQIAGSKMILKEGIYRLATQDLIAWWPFLFFSVACYGLLPRLVLALSGWIGKRRALDALVFNHTSCDRLVQRMQTPRLETGSRPYEKAKPPQTTTQAFPAEEMAVAEQIPFRMPAIVLIPDEIMDRTEPAEVNGRIDHFLAMDTVAILPVKADAETDSRALEQDLAAHGASRDSMRIVIVQEAWQPPIKETLSWLEALRQKAGDTTGMVIALIGKPATGTIYTPAADTDRLIWEQAVKGLGDPYMRVECLGG